MRRYDHVIFDFDGTLADTVKSVTESIKYALSTVGVVVEDEVSLKKYVGPPLKDTFSKSFGLGGDDLEKVMVEFRNRYDNEGILETEIFPGIVDMLRRLKNGGVKLSIASSKMERMVTAICERLGIKDYFDLIVGVKDSMDFSTKTENIQKAMANSGVPADRTAMVGDRYFDAEGAREAGVDFVAAMYSDMAPKEEFDDYPTVLFADSTSQLSDFVLGE